ncbi:MAG: acyloxyacyl hydrolase [Pseudomonadota bacterium]
MLTSARTHAEDLELQSVGIRLQVGEKSHVIGALQPESFRESDVEAVFGLPWEHQFQSGWEARARLVTHAGVLRGQSDSALVAVAIPTLTLGTQNGSFLIDTGLGLAYLSRHRFDLQDFGGPLQFALTLGIEVPLFQNYAAGYRFMHYSDAGFYAPGTIGADMHMVELLYRF